MLKCGSVDDHGCLALGLDHVHGLQNFLTKYGFICWVFPNTSKVS